MNDVLVFLVCYSLLFALAVAYADTLLAAGCENEMAAAYDADVPNVLTKTPVFLHTDELANCIYNLANCELKHARSEKIRVSRPNFSMDDEFQITARDG